MSEDTRKVRMEPGLNDLRRELHETDVFEVLSARRIAPNEMERIMHLVPYPQDIDVKNPLMEWTRLPLSSKIPFVKAPKDTVIVTRGKLGETVRRQGDKFDLSDPLNYNLRIDYDPIHDKHLRHYFFSPGNKKLLDDMGMLTEDNAVKCHLKEYNAYRRYVYNVHKNSVLNALREAEEIHLDKMTARDFLADALEALNVQFKNEEKEKQALRGAAYRRLIRICEQLLCERRLKRFDEIQEKKAKQKEREGIRLLVSQKKFEENLENYRVKSHDVAWKRNIKAQKKWRKKYDSDKQRKYIQAEIDRVDNFLQIIESWIQKDVLQIKTRERDTKIWKAFSNFSSQRKAARERNWNAIQAKNIGRLLEIKKHGPIPMEVLKQQAKCNYVGDVLAGFRTVKPDMRRVQPVVSKIKQTLKKALESGDRKTKQYWGTNLMTSRATSQVATNILQCVYKRALLMYIANAVYRHLPVLITQLKHVIVMFEEDMSRKRFSVDEIKRFIRSYVGSAKPSMFGPCDKWTTLGFIGKLSDRIYKSSKKHVCRCDSESETKSDSSRRKVSFEATPRSMIKETKKERRVSFGVVAEKNVNSEEAAMSNKEVTGVKLTQPTPRKKKGAVKGQEEKSKKKLPRRVAYSILKKCPLKGSDDEVCCSAARPKECSCDTEECQCSRQVFQVRFTVPESSRTLSEASSELESETATGKRVSFVEKITTYNFIPDVRQSQEDNPPASQLQPKKTTTFAQSQEIDNNLSDQQYLQGELSASKTINLKDDDMTSGGSACFSKHTKQVKDNKKSRDSLSQSSSKQENVLYQKKKYMLEHISEIVSRSDVADSSRIGEEGSFVSLASTMSSSDQCIYLGEKCQQEAETKPKTTKSNKLDDSRDLQRDSEHKFDGIGHQIDNVIPIDVSKPATRMIEAWGKSEMKPGIKEQPTVDPYQHITLDPWEVNFFRLRTKTQSRAQNEEGDLYGDTYLGSESLRKRQLPLFKEVNQQRAQTSLLHNMLPDYHNNAQFIVREVRKTEDEFFCKKGIRDEKIHRYQGKYKPPDFSLSEGSSEEETAKELSKSLKAQYLIAEKKEVDNSEASPLVQSEGETNVAVNEDEDGDESKIKSITPENLNIENTKFVQSPYSSGDRPRGVVLANCRKVPKCNLDNLQNKDRKVSAFIPKGKPKPKYGPLFKLKQVFEPSYKPVFSPNFICRTYGEPEVKSILKKTSYCPADNCSLVPKMLANYRLRSTADLKDFILLRTCLEQGEALAATKMDNNYAQDSDTLPHSSEKNKKKPQNLDELKKYSYEIVPSGQESYIKFFSRSQNVISTDKSVKEPTSLDYVNEMYKENLSSYNIDVSDIFVRHPEKSISVTKPLTEATQEVSKVYMEFFNRNETSQQNKSKLPRAEVLKSSLRKNKRPRSGPKSKAHQDVDHVPKTPPVHGINENSPGKAECMKDAESKGRTQPSESGSTSSTSSSESSSEWSLLKDRKFNLLNKAKPTAAIVCSLCGVCSHTPRENAPVSMDGSILRCMTCGSCVHNLLSRPKSSSDELIKTKKEESPAKELGKKEDDREEEDEEIKYLNDEEVRAYFFNKRLKQVRTRADLRAIFGPDFDPNKFVYFVDEKNEYVCWRDILSRRYPLRPFPWNTVKQERLRKRKLPIYYLKEYTHPCVIFQRKAAEGYDNWEASRKEELEEKELELKWNWVPPKYTKLFSTTTKPANRPARKFNPIKDRRPTPMPSMTDLVTRSIEETRCDLYEAKKKLKQDKSIFSIMKSKLDSTIGVMMTILADICILKMKKGYPDQSRMTRSKERNYYYMPQGIDRYSAKKLVRGLSEFVLSQRVKEMQFSKLEPLADIILLYVVDPDRHPLYFPDSAEDILRPSDIDEEQLSDNESFQ